MRDPSDQAEEPGDDILVAAYQAGQESALLRLFERHRPALFSYLTRLTEGHGDAQDLFQETWLRAIRNLPRFRAGHFRAWLYRIGHNLAVDRNRTQNRFQSLDQPLEESDGETGRDRLPDRGPDPAALASERDLGRTLQGLLATLPEAQREVFLLRTEAHLPFREIARLQGVSINTALARMQYAIDKLRAGFPSEAPAREEA